MDGQKDRTYKVPAEIYCNDLGVLSIAFDFIDNADSLLRKVIEGKTINEDKSVIGFFAKQICNAKTFFLPKSWIFISTQLQFADESDLKNSLEEINKRAMQALAEQLVKVSDNPCEYCANRDKCNAEADKQGEDWQEPSSDVCAQHVIQYFKENSIL